MAQAGVSPLIEACKKASSKDAQSERKKAVNILNVIGEQLLEGGSMQHEVRSRAMEEWVRRCGEVGRYSLIRNMFCI